VAFHNSWVGSLTNLRYLNLSFYGFGGSIPTQLGSLTHLRYLDLSFNKLDGKLPYQLANLSQLRYLDLGRNSFSRALPFQVGNLPLLHTLRLAGNFGVKPKVAEWLSNLSYLTNLSLYYLHNLDWLLYRYWARPGPTCLPDSQSSLTERLISQYLQKSGRTAGRPRPSYTWPTDEWPRPSYTWPTDEWPRLPYTWPIDEWPRPLHTWPTDEWPKPLET